MISNRQFPFAILMTGAPHVGRKALTLQYAAATLCPDAVDGVPCRQCTTCRQIAGGAHPDVETWSVDRQTTETGASKSASLTIETVRAIAASTSLRPFSGARRFLIVDDADTLGDAAQQALLKTLEDLPGYATIILIATSAGSMIDTVLSRCLEIPLQLAPTNLIAAALDVPNAEAIAALAAGRPGWAIRASASPEWLAAQQETIDGLEAWLRMSGSERLIEAYIRGDRFSRDRRSTLEGLDRIQLIWRDIVLAQTNLPQYVFDLERATRLTRETSAGLSDWRRALTATKQCIQDLTGNIRPRLAMQAMVNQWPNLS